MRDQDRLEEAVEVWREITPQQEHYLDAHFAAFQGVYLNNRNFFDAPTAFIEALPLCLNEEDNLLVFTGDNLKVFDGFLFAAAGIEAEADQIGRVTAELRITLMQYVLMRSLMVEKVMEKVVEKVPAAPVTGSVSTTSLAFFTEIRHARLKRLLENELAALPVIKKLEDCLVGKEPIEHCWDNVSRWLNSNLLENKNLQSLFKAVAQLGDAKKPAQPTGPT